MMNGAGRNSLGKNEQGKAPLQALAGAGMLATLFITTVGSLVKIGVLDDHKNVLGKALCAEQAPRVVKEKDIPSDATLTFASKECKAAWTNANGVKGAYSWDPVENVVPFPAAAVKTPAAMAPAQ